DMYDRLPTPYGLVRGGVAPDHQKIKSVTKVYEKTAAHPMFSFYGNVELGRDVTRQELKTRYHALIYAVGAQSDRRMGIPGEDLNGSHPATDFVAWYNGHPDYRDLSFDLSQERVAIIGNGNVAVDVARILASSIEELNRTDIADHALVALKKSNVKEIYMIGRRGPAQAAFTNAEIKELGELEECAITIPGTEGALDEVSKKNLEAHPDSGVSKNLEIMKDYLDKTTDGKRKKMVLRFLWSPVELKGREGVEEIVLQKNILVQDADGSIKAKGTEAKETIPVGLVFRSIGYKGVALKDVPFDEKKGIIPNAHGRVTELNGTVIPGEYTAGWIKRGPSGVIGTNKPDALESVNMLLEDVKSGHIHPIDQAASTTDWLQSKKIRFVTFADWLKIDKAETEKGMASGRPRIKFTRIEDMLHIAGV
ncbi:MAG TPA: FAD-dependent oxidoreductase, partial [bacterium]|nr:FAD-dependent oxidoreductase [bacterium]